MRHHPDCGQCRAHENGHFACLQGELLDRLRAARIARAYEAGQPIFYEDAPALAVYCVSEGEVKLWRAGIHGEVQVVGTRKSGDLLGARAVLAGGNYTCTAEPLHDMTVCAVPGTVFLDLLRAEPQLALVLLQRIAELTIESEAQLVARSMENVRQRTARYLLHLIPEDRALAGGPVELSHLLARAEMADLIGTTPETLSRTLTTWVGRGLLTVGKGTIVVNDPEALRRIAR